MIKIPIIIPSLCETCNYKAKKSTSKVVYQNLEENYTITRKNICEECGIEEEVKYSVFAEPIEIFLESGFRYFVQKDCISSVICFYYAKEAVFNLIIAIFSTTQDEIHSSKKKGEKCKELLEKNCLLDKEIESIFEKIENYKFRDVLNIRNKLEHEQVIPDYKQVKFFCLEMYKIIITLWNNIRCTENTKTYLSEVLPKFNLLNFPNKIFSLTKKNNPLNFEKAILEFMKRDKNNKLQCLNNQIINTIIKKQKLTLTEDMFITKEEFKNTILEE